MTIAYHDVQWYISKIERNDPYCSLLFGDGEFLVASRTRTNGIMQYNEMVTTKLENEMRDSLNDCSPGIIRGTDESLIDYTSYRGRDIEQIKSISIGVQSLLAQFPTHDWVDGTLWDAAVREGKLGPLLKVLRDRSCILVGNSKLCEGMKPILKCQGRTYELPEENAFEVIDKLESDLLDWMVLSGDRSNIYVLCMGLGAIPLIMRLRKRPEFKDSTFLDLGSVLDVFVRGSPQRGWRRELYSGPMEAYTALIDANLKELK
jgi:hypothetical protein